MAAGGAPQSLQATNPPHSCALDCTGRTCSSLTHAVLPSGAPVSRCTRSRKASPLPGAWGARGGEGAGRQRRSLAPARQPPLRSCSRRGQPSGPRLKPHSLLVSSWDPLPPLPPPDLPGRTQYTSASSCPTRGSSTMRPNLARKWARVWCTAISAGRPQGGEQGAGERPAGSVGGDACRQLARPGTHTQKRTPAPSRKQR